jgi:MerR family mercuric resistance operon transcriptional regulator
MLKLGDNNAQSCANARDIAAAQLAATRARQHELARIEAILTDTLRACDAQCCASPAPPCPILEFSDARD